MVLSEMGHQRIRKFAADLLAKLVEVRTAILGELELRVALDDAPTKPDSLIPLNVARFPGAIDLRILLLDFKVVPSGECTY